MTDPARPSLDVPFNSHVRVEFTEVAPGTCVARIPEAHELTNHLGTVHGGALFTVAEAASGRAFMESALAQAAQLGWDLAQFRAVVRDASIRFRKPARGEIFARAHVVTPGDEWSDALQASGKATADVAVEVQDATGMVVAEMNVQWHLAQRSGLAKSAS